MTELAVLGALGLVGVFIAGVWFRSIDMTWVLASIPALNVVADSTIFLTEGSPLHSGVIRFILLVSLIAFLLPRVRVSRLSGVVFVFLVYLAAIGAAATDLERTYTILSRVFVSLMMLPIAYYSFCRIDQLKKLRAGVIAAVVLIVVSFALAQVFKIGASVYVEDTIYLGTYTENSGVYVAYILAYAAVLIPSLNGSTSAQRRIHVVSHGLLLAAALIVLVLIFRRGAMLACAVGMSVYVFYSPRRVHLMKAGAVAALVALACAPLYWRPLVRLAQARGDVVGFVRNTERGRMAEFGYVAGEFWEGSIKHRLFGTDLFNSLSYMDVRRSLHVDYTHLLLTAGVVGVALYLAVFACIALELRRRPGGGSPEGTFTSDLRAAGFGLVAASLTLSFSTQLWALSPLAFFFLCSGALLGILHRMPRQRDWQVPSSLSRPVHAGVRGY